MIAVLSLALADRSVRLIGLSAAVVAFALFATAGQMVAWADGRLALLVTPDRLVVFVVLAALAGLNGTLQGYALRLRLGRGGQSAGVTGIILAFVGASCCTPLLWPAVLSLLGVSGVALLGINAALHRWFWIPVSLAGLALLVSTWRTARAIVTPCPLTVRAAAEAEQVAL